MKMMFLILRDHIDGGQCSIAQWFQMSWLEVATGLTGSTGTGVNHEFIWFHYTREFRLAIHENLWYTSAYKLKMNYVL